MRSWIGQFQSLCPYPGKEGPHVQEGGPLVASVYNDSLRWGLKPASSPGPPLSSLAPSHNADWRKSGLTFPADPKNLEPQDPGHRFRSWLASHPPEMVRGELGFTAPQPQASCRVGLPCLSESGRIELFLHQLP